jgi:hypothetical protein
MFSLNIYSVIDNAGLPLCDLRGNQLELKEVVQMLFNFKKILESKLQRKVSFPQEKVANETVWTEL